MLKTLTLENFTVFTNTELEFSPGINVIIGENGTGKTHLLKAGYCFSRALSDLMRDRVPLSKKWAEIYFERRLTGLFQSDHLKNLVRIDSLDAYLSAEIELSSKVGPVSWCISVHNNDDVGSDVSRIEGDLIEHIKLLDVCDEKIIFLPIFIPSKEVVSFYEGLGGLLDEYKIKLDATYRDMASNFDFPELKNTSELPIIEEFDEILGGRLELEGKRLVFIGNNGHKMETPLMAEGFRKLAMLPYFIRHGLIRGKNGETLFWDEPEANLNPRLITKLAEALIILARHGVQIILATHSLLLLKEIDLQLQLAIENNNAIPARFFALSLGENGVETSVGNVLEEIDPITALDMEIEQAERYNDWYDRVSHADH